MPRVDDFYSVNEINKPADQRVYHDNSACSSARHIPKTTDGPAKVVILIVRFAPKKQI